MFKKVFKLYKGLQKILSDPFLIIIGPLLLVFTFFAKNILANFIFFLVFGFYFIFFLMFIFFEKALPFLFLLQIREPVFYLKKKIDTDSRSKRTFATLLTPSLLKKLYQNPVIKKKVDQQVEQSMTQAVEILNNQAVEILNNMGRPLATLIGGSLLGGGLYLEHQTRETGREIHNNSCLTQDRKIQELFEQKRYHRADLLDARKEWDHLCFERMRDHGMVSTVARDLFDIPLTEENTFTKDERKRWEQRIDDLVKKEVIETREFDKAREIHARKLIEDQERAARVANFKSIPKTHIHRLLWEGLKMGYNEPQVKEGLQTLFQQLTSILIAKGTEAAVKKFEEVVSRGLDGEGAGRIGSPLEERSGYVNQFYTNFLTTFTSFQYYAEKELEQLRDKYGDDLTPEIISHHFILNPFLESEEYEYLLFKMQQEYEEQYNEDPSSFESGESSSFESGESSSSTFSEYRHSDEGASTSHPNDPANRPLRRTDSISDQKDLDLAEERKQKILLMEQNDKLKEQIREAALIEQKKKAADMYNRLREESKKDTIKAHQPKDPDDSEDDDNYNPYTDKGKGKKKYF